MKIYNVIQFFIGEDTDIEVNVYPYLDEVKAREKYNAIADDIFSCVKENFESYGTDDDEADAVFQRDDEKMVCDAWQSYSALTWEYWVKVETKEID